MATIRIKPDMLLGRIVVQLGLATQAAVDACVAEQDRARRDGHRRYLGEILVERKALTRAQLDDILIGQIYAEVSADDTRFGQLAVKNGLATLEQVEACMKKRDALYEQGKEVVCLGQLMREAGILTDQQVEALLQAQERLKHGA
jgi:hypothetical protein